MVLDNFSQIDFEQQSTCTPCLGQPIIKKEHHIKKYQQKYRNPAYHDFMFLGTNTEESQIICWVQLTHHTTGFICKLTDQTSVLNGGGVVQS
jgi:hypothetical protein